ncbi:uncharacterized protein DUF397 [Saccharothrix australiensis]|uniref:Uncharacterized protein DUF397 n=1 Tax=Saccharothrix australiensis TaxID=2072 RepID=A0A495W843_9PSEU|nr:DUF397 domain-containing protein [Saccharothrix australiensis]RKT56793.1 uncharacterized protein DUF397 [Saccharothrix australiensis]
MRRRWRRSGRSSASGSDCVEIALADVGAAVRDSKDRAGGALSFGAAQWSRFVGGAKGGRYDGR